MKQFVQKGLCKSWRTYFVARKFY